MSATNHWRMYFKYFNEAGEYEADWTEVTPDVRMDSISDLKLDLDNTDYDIGVYKSSNFNITMRNDFGYYSDVGEPNSRFMYTRTNTLVKITWEVSEAAYLGTALVGHSYISLDETTVFIGLLTDETLEMGLVDQSIRFTVLGREAVFQKAIVPFSDITNGMAASDLIYTLLNQDVVTKVLTVDLGNINPSLDPDIDDITPFENIDVQKALKDLLLVTNSVIYIDEDGSVMVSARTPTADVQQTFYGQASTLGAEDIQDIKSVKNGLARTFNYITWSGTSQFAENAESGVKYGYRTKDIGVDFITDTGEISNALNAIRDEFGAPKMEFDLYTPLNFEVMGRNLLDRINIDYPTVYINTTNPLPICGAAVCGTAVLPRAGWAFTLNTLTHFKILGRAVSTQKGIVKFKVRAI